MSFERETGVALEPCYICKNPTAPSVSPNGSYTVMCDNCRSTLYPAVEPQVAAVASVEREVGTQVAPEAQVAAVSEPIVVETPIATVAAGNAPAADAV